MATDLKFKYTILYIEDVTKTLNFFEKAFGFKQTMLHESGDYGELATGATTLSFSSLKLMSNIGKNPGRANASSPTFEIAFETNDVAAALAKALGRNTRARLPRHAMGTNDGLCFRYQRLSDRNLHTYRELIEINGT